MTKHEASRQFKSPTAAERRRWQQDMLRFTHACAGALESYVVPAGDLPRLTVLAALSGEPTGRALARAIKLWRRQALAPGAHVPCLDCDVRFGPELPPAAYAVSLPFADRGHALVTGVCASCAERKDLQQVMRRLLRQIFPDAYSVKEGGHG